MKYAVAPLSALVSLLLAGCPTPPKTTPKTSPKTTPKGTTPPTSSPPAEKPIAMKLSTGENPTGLLLDEKNAYYVDATAGTISKVSKEGGVPQLLVDSQKKPRLISVDAEGVYFITSDGSLKKVPLEGGSPQDLVKLETFSISPGTGAFATPGSFYLSSDKEGIYNAASCDTARTACIRLQKVEKQKGTLSLVATAGLGSPWTLQTIAVDDDNLYLGVSAWAKGWEAAVVQVSKAGGRELTLASGPVNKLSPVALAVGESDIFWLDAEKHKLLTVPKTATGQEPRDLAPWQDKDGLLVIDDERVYFTDKNRSLVKEVLVEGGVVSTVVTGQNISGLAVDSACLYWTDEDEGTLRRTGK